MSRPENVSTKSDEDQRSQASLRSLARAAHRERYASTQAVS